MRRVNEFIVIILKCKSSGKEFKFFFHRRDRVDKMTKALGLIILKLFSNHTPPMLTIRRSYENESGSREIIEDNFNVDKKNFIA